ncbi:MAG: DUF2207 domain-containing protein [Chloroflexota bacterium]|nr:DUF2207 domain-containing protein [Chloroflexota bacterium]MDE2883788.1 DUF2207 domain-containing protein [Chloroflexota bacterium]
MSVLLALAVLAAIGLLFAMDPGGAIAESGFPDFQEMDWKQLAVWGFRTIGVVLAQLIIIVLGLWPRYRPPRASTWYAGTPRPGSMPAAAVSTLQGHMLWSPTVLASIIEMCQRGTLRIEAVGTRVGFLYRLSRQGLTQYDWERTICDSLPSGPTTIDALREAIGEREDAIGDQIGDYLQQRGLFDGNPVRVRRENTDDGGTWWMLACILTGVGSGLWAALWLDQWWANALIGLFAGLAYSFFTVPGRIRTGMLKPTPVGVLEITQWLGWKESMAGPALLGAQSQSDPMLAYAVAFDVAQPWLDVGAAAPPWFGSRGESSPRGVDLDVAYRAFMHAPEWYLSGRSDDAAKAAAQRGYEEELKLLGQLDMGSPDAGTAVLQGTDDASGEAVSELETQTSFLEAVPPPPSVGYQQHTTERPIDEPKSGGCLCGCLRWLVVLMGIGTLVLLVLLSLDVVSPRDKPCSLDSLPIPTPAQIAVAGDLFRDECVRVRGTVVFQDTDELVIEMDRGEYVQRVDVRDPSEVLQSIVSPGRVVNLAGRLRVEEDGTYAVLFIPDRGSDREWWRNLRENLEAVF